MSAIVSGLIGGVVATLVAAYIARRVGRGSAPGQLRYGYFLWGLAIACVAFALFPTAITVFAGHDADFGAKVGLTLLFGAGAIYCLAEANWVRGSFDVNGIAIATPWSGSKQELWKDLVSVEFNGWCAWYVLTYTSGAKIRLSIYLGGHLAALEMAQAQAPPRTLRGSES